MGRKPKDRRIEQLQNKLLDRLVNEDDSKKIEDLLAVYDILLDVIEKTRLVKLAKPKVQ